MYFSIILQLFLYLLISGPCVSKESAKRVNELVKSRNKKTKVIGGIVKKYSLDFQTVVKHEHWVDDNKGKYFLKVYGVENNKYLLKKQNVFEWLTIEKADYIPVQKLIGRNFKGNSLATNKVFKSKKLKSWKSVPIAICEDFVLKIVQKEIEIKEPVIKIKFCCVGGMNDDLFYDNKCKEIIAEGWIPLYKEDGELSIELHSPKE